MKRIFLVTGLLLVSAISSAYAQTTDSSDLSVSQTPSASDSPAPVVAEEEKAAMPMISADVKKAVLSRYGFDNYKKLVYLKMFLEVDIVNNTDRPLSVIIPDRAKYKGSGMVLSLDSGTALIANRDSDVTGIGLCDQQELAKCTRELKDSYVSLQPHVPARILLSLTNNDAGEEITNLPAILSAKTASLSTRMHVIDSDGVAQLIPFSISDIPIVNTVKE